jgi:hypothetical protein
MAESATTRTERCIGGPFDLHRASERQLPNWGIKKPPQMQP